MLRAVTILKDHQDTYEALVTALLEGKTLGDCVRVIEESLAVKGLPADTPPPNGLPMPLEAQAKRVPSSLQEPPAPAFVAFEQGSGRDILEVMEERERERTRLQEEKYEAKLREVERKLRVLNARMTGATDEDIAKAEEAAFDSRLAELERKLQAIDAQLSFDRKKIKDDSASKQEVGV